MDIKLGRFLHDRILKFNVMLTITKPKRISDALRLRTFYIGPYLGNISSYCRYKFEAIKRSDTISMLSEDYLNQSSLKLLYIRF